MLGFSKINAMRINPFNAFLSMNKFRSIIATLFAIFLFACGGSTDSPSEKLSAPGEQKILVQNGYLVFADEKAFAAAETALNNMRTSDREAWENQFPGFKSMRADFKTASQRIDALENQAAEGSPNDSPIQERIDKIISEHSHSITRLKDDDGDFSLHMNIPFHSRGSIVNHLGLVQVGKKLFHYELRATRSAPADISIDALMNISASTSKKGISFEPTAYYSNAGKDNSQLIVQADVKTAQPPLGDPSIIRFSRHYIPGEVGTYEGKNPIHFKVELENATTKQVSYHFAITSSFLDRIQISETTFTNGVYLSPIAQPSTFQWNIYVPEGVKEFFFTIKTHDNGVVNEIEELFVNIGGHSSFPGVAISDPNYPPSSGVIWQNTHQEKSSDGRDKLYVWEQLSYKIVHVDQVEYTYKVNVDTQHKKHKNSNWSPVESDITVKSRWYLNPNFYDSGEDAIRVHDFGVSFERPILVYKKGFAGVPAAHGYIDVDVGYANINFHH